MKYPEALTALIDQRYADMLRNAVHMPSWVPDTRDMIAASDKNIRIADELFGEAGVGDTFYKDDRLEFGVFNNCREYGLTVSLNGWTFCAYEHRNSDDICIEGCPDRKVQEWGPYGGEDKYDVLFSARWKQYHEAAAALIAALQAVDAAPEYATATGTRLVIVRNALKSIMKEAAAA